MIWNALRRANWKLLGAALLAAAIVHICVTFAAPHLGRSDAFARLSDRLPRNSMIVLPPVAPSTQVLPFQSPDLSYAMCRYDASVGPIVVRAGLPESGWTFSLYAPGGESFYLIPGLDNRRIDVGLVLTPPGDRFVDVAPVPGQVNLTEVPLPARDGLVVIRALNKGQAYRAQIAGELARATCAPARA